MIGDRDLPRIFGDENQDDEEAEWEEPEVTPKRRAMMEREIKRVVD